MSETSPSTREELQRAIDLYTKALESHGAEKKEKYALIYYSRAGAYARQGVWAKMLSDSKQCVALKSDWPKGYCRLGAAHFGLDQLDEAAAAYNEALRLAPADAEVSVGARAALQDVRQRQERAGMDAQIMPRVMEFARRKTAAAAQLAQGRFAEAETEYTCALVAMREVMEELPANASAPMRATLQAIETSMRNELQQARTTCLKPMMQMAADYSEFG